MATKNEGATALGRREIMRAVDVAWARLSEQGFLCRALPDKSRRSAVQALTRQIVWEYLRPDGVVYYCREDLEGLCKTGELSLSCGALRREWDNAVAGQVVEVLRGAGLNVSRSAGSNSVIVCLPATPAEGHI